ncbi:multidrug DMT transporter permease [Legionella jordanis]|uniref:multidrug DMT transporter permease n=1 Tax=Legionella jordanis TaxID=456 RepID=UPI000EFE450A|nr:multidrug DMT transporter permease [Legionella jordanis]RMX19251.1 multidrug DMT transporter permease [Legionella jordanis]
MMRLAAVFLVILTSCFSINLYAEGKHCEQQRCVAVVDAGSTGSRLHIYSYDLDSTQTPVNVTEVWNKKIKPGLATIEPNAATIDAYLTALFSGVPESKLPVYFYATAGMRLLPQPKQQQFYTLMQQWFANQSNWTLQQAKTITGSEEGLFGWLAVNYQLGALNSKDKELAGVMDMGGASVQIIFPVQNADNVNPQDLKQFSLYGRQFNLFIHSFLGLGQTEVTHQFLDESTCFSDNYELPTGFTAAGDAYNCESSIAPLMNVHKVKRTVAPAMEGSQINNWFVLGGMAELAKSKPFEFNGQFSNQDLLEQANSQVCHQSWDSLKNQYPENEYLYGYCLFSAYYYALMVEGYGLEPQQTVSLLPNNQGSDWTIGVVLNQKPV